MNDLTEKLRDEIRTLDIRMGKLDLKIARRQASQEDVKAVTETHFLILLMKLRVQNFVTNGDNAMLQDLANNYIAQLQRDRNYPSMQQDVKTYAIMLKDSIRK